MEQVLPLEQTDPELDELLKWYCNSEISKKKTVDASHPPVEVGEKVGRNDPCPCGSGKKHKKCCLNK